MIFAVSRPTTARRRPKRKLKRLRISIVVDFAKFKTSENAMSAKRASK